MAKKREPVDDVLDAIVWMRRKSKKREAVDDFIDALLSMRSKTVKQAKKTKKPIKTKTSERLKLNLFGSRKGRKPAAKST